MPIQKFRSVEEMNAAPILVVAAGNAFERFARHCGRFRLIYPRTYPRGVFRFRSLKRHRPPESATMWVWPIIQSLQMPISLCLSTDSQKPFDISNSLLVSSFLKVAQC